MVIAAYGDHVEAGETEALCPLPDSIENDKLALPTRLKTSHINFT
jgi:hypothetical protein